MATTDTRVMCGHCPWPAQVIIYAGWPRKQVRNVCINCAVKHYRYGGKRR